MKENSCGEVTGLLEQVASGDEAAMGRLVDLVYDELRCMAKWRMTRVPQGHSWQTTDLVDEAVLKLLGGKAIKSMPNRRYFFGAAVRAMRQVLVDHARQRLRRPDDGGGKRVPLDDVIDSISRERKVDLLALDEALERLEAEYPRKYEVIMRKFFGGSGMQEIADDMGLSKSAVEKDFTFAKAWLRQRMEGGQSNG